MDSSEGFHLVVQRREVNEKNKQAADGKRAFQDMPRAEPENRPGPERGYKAGAKAVDAAKHRAALLRAYGVVGELAEAFVFAVLLHECLDHRDAGECLLQVGLDAALDLTPKLRGKMKRFADEEGSSHHEWRDGECQQRETGIESCHEEHHQPHCHQGMARREDDGVHELINAPTVAGDSAHCIADGMAAVENQRPALQPCEQFLREVIDHPSSGDRPGGREHQFNHAVEREEQQPPDGREGKQGKRRRFKVEHLQTCGQCAGQRVLTQHMVGDELHRPGLKGGQGGGNQRQNSDDGKPAPVWTQARQKQAPDAREATSPLRWYQRWG